MNQIRDPRLQNRKNSLTSNSSLSNSIKKSNNAPGKIQVSKIRKFRPAFLKEQPDEVVSVDFSEDGKFVLCAYTGSYKNGFKVYRIDQGSDPNRTEIEIATSDKIGSAIFYDRSKILFTNKDNHIIKIIDFKDDTFIPIIFRGHDSEITTLQLIPHSQNKFITAGTDNYVNIWDARKNRVPYNEFKTNLHPFATCHPFRREMAIVTTRDIFQYIEIYAYDSKKLIFKFEVETEKVDLSEIKYSPNGKFLMINTRDCVIIIVHPEKGILLNLLQGYDNLHSVKINACFTPCSNYVLTGSHIAPHIHCWELSENGNEKVAKFVINSYIGPCYKLAFNSKGMCFASAGEKNFWIWIEA